ncbi:MAG: chemotaxis protein CheD [Spirochaetota bacterium]
MRIDVGIGEFKYSHDPSDVLKTYGLGSCVALAVYNQKRRIAGLVHIALPEAAVNPAKAAQLPGYFADTGIAMVIDWIDKVAQGQRKSFTYKLYGGASILDENNRFDIGRRNSLAIKRLLWRYGCGVIKEDIGGTSSRTVTIAVETGEVHVNYVQKRTDREVAGYGTDRRNS